MRVLPDDNGQNEENIFLKVAPDNRVRRERFHVRASFLREIFVYKEVKTKVVHTNRSRKRSGFQFLFVSCLQILPLFREIQISNEIRAIDDQFRAYCECFHSIDSDMNEALFLEDLGQQKFKMLNHRIEAMSMDHARLVLTALGQLHGISFVLKNQSAAEFAQLVQQMPEVFICSSDEYLREFFEELKIRILGSLDPMEDSAIISKLQHLFGASHFEVARSCVDGLIAEPYAVICHGDCWNNNILFKYDKVIQI